MKVIILLTTLCLFANGCASIGKAWKGLVSSDPDPKTVSANGANGANGQNSADPNNPGGGISFNTVPNYGTYQERQYKRVTKQNFEENQSLEESAGSLWKKEGQGSYLFSQNNLRVMGDVINVDVDGRAAENLNTKISIIKKNMSKFEVPAPRPVSRPIARIPKPEDDQRNPSAQAAAASPVMPLPQPQVAAVQPTAEQQKEEKVKFDPVTCRIVEKNVDGSYRIKGMQSIVIGRKEYKLIVTGVVRADDINTDNIPASKIIESKFDLVATNREIDK